MAPSSLCTIEQALSSPQLLQPALGDLASWRTWISVLKACYGQKLTSAEQKAFATVSGNRAPPTRKVRELVGVISRRAGKGRAAGALATYESALVDHSQHLAPGETGVVACISPTRAQANVVKDYTLGFFQSSPVLRDEVLDVTSDEIRLRNGVIIATLTSDYRTLRGRTLLLAVLDEAAFLRDELSSTPDIEAARALLPGLSTSGGMLCVFSSPYRRAGLLYQRHRDFFGKDNADVLVVAGPSALFNPTIDQGLIAAARISDPQAALSEWDGEFRSDLAAFLDDATIEIAIDRDRPLELPPQDGVTYYAFADASAGRHDAFTLCIVHQERERVVADLVCGRPAPFDPATVAAEYAALAKKYHCQSITGDNFAGEWTVNAFTTAGIEYRRSQLTKSELYLEGLPWFSRGLVSIPDSQVLLRELRLLERRVARSGKDSVDHGPSGNDDYSNALFGGINLATRREFEPPLVAPVIVVTKRECFGDSTYTGGFTTDRSPVHLPLSPRSFP